MTATSEDLEPLVRDAAFAHGYAVVAGASLPPEVAHWPRVDVGRFTYATHPRAVVTRTAAEPGRPWRRRARAEVVLLGHPVDVATATHDPAVIARSVLAALGESVESAVREVAYLGGRFTAFLHHEDGMTVVPDTHATQPVFWSVEGDGVAVASHSVLVARALGRGPDARALGLYDGIRAVRPKGTIFMPGMTTPWDGVRPLIPNCRLDVRLGRAAPSARLQRFWPFEDRVEDADVDRVYDRFREQILGHLRLLGSFGTVGLSLTAGLDSRVTLAGLLLDGQRDAFAFTYASPRAVGRDAAVTRDVFGASELAFRAGLPHRLVHWRTPEDCWLPQRAQAFREAYDRSWPEKQGSVGAAYSMYADLPHDFVELQSNLAETGTTHTRTRTDEPISPRRLAELWLGKVFADHPQYHDDFAVLIDAVDFSAPALRGHDHHDVFYWEHRMSRWAARKFQEGDMSHRVLLPFNDRGLIETMLSLPQPMRAAKVLYGRLLDEVPQVRDVAAGT